MPTTRIILATALLGVALTGCRFDAVTEEAAPDGYHRMTDSTLMANVQMETEYRDLMGDGILLPTHTTPEGDVRLGPAPDNTNGEHGGHRGHAVPDPADFAQGVIPVGIQLPRLDVTAPVVATTMTSGAIEGPPVAGDVAWLSQTRRPGETGPAILGGVFDLDGQPGAYAGLEQLSPGDEFVIASEDGDLLPYRVDSVGWRPVAERQDIFAMGPGDASEVRLVAWSTDDADDYVVSAFAVTTETDA